MFTAHNALLKATICFALIIAMAAAAFAHSGGRPAMTPEIAQYLAAGGSFSDICGSLEDPDGAQGQKCEACRIMGAALVPNTCNTAPVVLTQHGRTLRFIAQLVHNSRPLDPARLTRAPPLQA